MAIQDDDVSTLIGSTVEQLLAMFENLNTGSARLQHALHHFPAGGIILANQNRPSLQKLTSGFCIQRRWCNLCLSVLQRHLHPEPTATPRLAVCPDTAIHQFRQTAG